MTAGCELLDFGLATERNAPSGDRSNRTATPRHIAPSDELTREGTILGTVSYMSPEQDAGAGARPNSALRRSSPSASLLYELVTGRASRSKVGSRSIDSR